MRAFDKIILCVIAVLAVSIGLFPARHSTPTPPSAPVIVQFEPHERIQFDRRIEQLSVQNATFEQLINKISKAANITVICQPAAVATTVPAVTVSWTNVRLDTALWVAFTVFERDPRLLFTDEKGRLVEGQAGHAVPAGSQVLYDFRSIHMTEGDTEPSSVAEHLFEGAWADTSFAYSTSWKAFGAIIDKHVSIHQDYNNDLARPYLVSEKTIGRLVPMRAMIRALTHPRSPGESSQPLRFVGASRINDLRLTNVSVGDALREACEASHVNAVFAFPPDNEPAGFISVELRDVGLSEAISKIFDSSPFPPVGVSVREIDGVAVVCDANTSIAQYPVVYDVRKIVQSPKAWYDPSHGTPIPNDEFVDKQDPYLLPGIDLDSLLSEGAGLNGQLSEADYWRGRIIVKAPLQAHRAIEKMLARISTTGRVEDESQ